jgi:hypothetical protein
MTGVKRSDNHFTGAFFFLHRLEKRRAEKSEKASHGSGKRCHMPQPVINAPKIP